MGYKLRETIEIGDDDDERGDFLVFDEAPDGTWRASFRGHLPFGTGRTRNKALSALTERLLGLWRACSEVATHIFNRHYKLLSDEGACDVHGGAEYSRVLKEWIAAGQPEDVEGFIRERANRVPS